MTFNILEKIPSITWFEKRAQQLRKETSERIVVGWNSSHAKLDDYSHFDLYHDKLPLPSGRAALVFNDLVTTTVLTEHVLLEEDPYIVTFLASKVIEQTFYQIYDPIAPCRPIKNLSVAKHYGIFFTPPHIAEVMVKGLSRKEKISTLLDPCLGSGVLLCASLIFSNEYNYEQLIGVELDKQLAEWAKIVIKRVAELSGYNGKIAVVVGDGLSYLLTETIMLTANETSVIINPPYGRLRLTKDRATNTETSLQNGNIELSTSVSNLQASVADYVKHLRMKYSFIANEHGILEYSKLFFRACAELAFNGAMIAIISPDSWMSGSAGRALRKVLLERRLIDRIILIEEDGGKFSTVNQATSITFLDQSDKKAFRIDKLSEPNKSPRMISYERLKSMAQTDFAIPRVSGFDLELFERLSQLTKLGRVSWVTNARGEVDQTVAKPLFLANKTKIRLVRGEHVERFAFKHSSSLEKPSYLDPHGFIEFITNKPKHQYYDVPRIVGRQCSYAQQSRRLLFCQIPAKHAVGNSCNFISVASENEIESAERLYILLGLLNSAVLDWYFRIENSNNHVGNYEIDNLPFPELEEWFPVIISCAYQLEQFAKNEGQVNTDWLVDLLEAAVGLSYGLNPETELRAILSQIGSCNVMRSVNFAVHMKRGVRFLTSGISNLFFNHLEPSLSELDRLIISYVPEGGNWQNIPDSVPSKRLKQIREMTAERGVVRTTYYGRLRRDQPAYTINTYYNRPGNGTHIHPVIDRTLTSREAARLQSFPDKYIFLGSEGAIHNQIGNAVPPLLALAIGKKFIQYAQSRCLVDVFCGAGGLSLGLENAGWEIIGAIDNNKEALDTYCFNRPCDLEPKAYRAGYTSVFRRDLHDLKAFENIIEQLIISLNGRSLDMLVGGPPCQGFSHAGFRLIDDKRNDLASIYLHFAEMLRPRIFLLENVEGLVTFNKGQVLKDICRSLKDIGYRVFEPVWILCAEQYGTPQMRRRVFVVATTDSLIDLRPPEPVYKKCNGRREARIDPDLFDSVLRPPHTVSDALSGLSLPVKSSNELLRWLSGYEF